MAINLHARPPSRFYSGGGNGQILGVANGGPDEDGQEPKRSLWREHYFEARAWPGLKMTKFSVLSRPVLTTACLDFPMLLLTALIFLVSCFLCHVQ
jgi:hypothetical protein